MESKSESSVRRSVVLGSLASLVLVFGCGGEALDQSSRGIRVEGTEPGDCQDDADNDADGYFDCADPGCSGSSACLTEGDAGVGGAGGSMGDGGTGGEGGVAGSGGTGGVGGTGGTGGMTGSGGMAGSGGMDGTGGSGGMVGSGGMGGTGGSGGMVGSGGTGGTAGMGGGVPVECTTSLLCQLCPAEDLCDGNSDCTVGSVCIESGCDDLGGAPIKHCVSSFGGACVSSAHCPVGRECIDVPDEGMRCVKTTPGCDTSSDCVLGFSCENGGCVDRRVPCGLDWDCPKNHVCGGTTNSNFCLRIQRDCVLEFDCIDLAPRCEDIDGDGNKECAGTFDPAQPSPVACVNAMCADPSAPVCEASNAGSMTSCGQYGLCLDNADCAAGFNCVGLWPDGRKECTPSGGSCSSLADCSVRQVCASPRGGGPPSCQAGAEGAACQSVQITPSRSIPNVMFLVDQSGSMDADFGGGQDRWEATHSAITQIVSELDSIVRFGLTTYQSDDGDMNPPCPRLDTQVEMNLNNFSEINASYPAAFPGGADTPTGDAIDALVDIIQSNPPPAEGPTIIVLATDGEPDSCEVPDPNPTAEATAEALTAAQNAYGAGMETFILSVGTDVSNSHLQEMANAGVGLAVDGSEGDAAFWVATSPASLEGAFQGIISDSISCDVQMDKPFDDKDKACNDPDSDVRLDGTPLSCPSEWQVKPGVDDVIELLGAACDTFKSGEVTFSATFPCGAIVVD